MGNDRLRNLIANRMVATGKIVSDRERSNAYVGVRITEVEKFGRLWQIAFVDGEACEIKRILPKGRVMTVCYGEEDIWENRQDAIDFFERASAGCDPESHEAARYSKILAELMLGMKVCTDEED